MCLLPTTSAFLLPRFSDDLLEVPLQRRSLGGNKEPSGAPLLAKCSSLRIPWVIPWDAQRATPRKQSGSRSFFVAAMGTVLNRTSTLSQASCIAQGSYTARLLISRCTSRGRPCFGGIGSFSACSGSTGQRLIRDSRNSLQRRSH